MIQPKVYDIHQKALHSEQYFSKLQPEQKLQMIALLIVERIVEDQATGGKLLQQIKTEKAAHAASS